MPESSATTLDELWVKFSAKFENIERGLKEMQTQGRKVDSIWKGIGNTVKTVFSFFAIQKIVQWGKALIGMGTDSARQMRQVDAALAALGDRFIKVRPLIDEHAQRMIALGFDDEETARSMAHLLGVTRDWNTALEINAVAMDLAAYKSISLEAATQALSRAWAGNTRMLREFGIDVREGARGMEVLRTVAARVQGQAAASVDPLKVMGIMLRNMGEDIGKQLLPAVYSLFNAFNRLGPSIGPLIGQLAQTFGQLLDAVGPLVESLGQGLVTALQGAAPLINVITGFVGQLMQLLAPYIPMIAQFIGQVLQQAAPILQALAEAILQVLAAVLPLLPQILSLASALIDMLIPAFEAISPALDVVIAAIRLVVIAIAALIGYERGWIKLGGELVKAVKEQWTTIWQIIKKFAEAISKVLVGAGDVIAGVFTLDIDRVKKGANAVWNALKQFGEDWVQGVGQLADNALKTLTKTIPDGVKKAAQEAVNAAIDVFDQGEQALAQFGRIGTPGQTTGGTGTTTWTPPAAPAGPEAATGGGTVGEERNEALENYLKLLDHEIAMGQVSLEQQRERLQEALKLTKTQDERWQIEERIYALDKQLAELPYEERRRELDHRVAMGELTLQQQLTELKNLRDLATTEEQRRQIDEEIYALEQKIASLPYEERMRELDHRVAMGELTLEQQREELQNLLQINLTEEQRWQIEERIHQINEQLAEQARNQAEEARQQTEQLKQSWSSFLQDWAKGGFKMSDIWDRIMARLLDKFIDTLIEMAAANDKYGLLQALGDLLGLGVSLDGSTPASPGGGAPTSVPVDVPVAVAARGMVVPQTRRAVPALLHEREMVLPRQLSEGLQRLIASGGGGDTFNVTIQAVDAPSIVRLFSRPEVRGPVLKHVRDELRQKGRI